MGRIKFIPGEILKNTNTYPPKVEKAHTHRKNNYKHINNASTESKDIKE